MQEPGMYGEHAELYDLIYHWKDYEGESDTLRRLLAAEGVQDGSRILEAACGTGSFLACLSRWYDVSGFDLNEPVLAIARSKVPEAPVFRADMRSFSVAEPFDALLCLFGSIGYVLSLDELERTARAFAAALRPGGVLVLEPWVAPEQWRSGHVFQHLYDSERLRICRQSFGGREGDVSTIEFQWLVARADQGIEHFVERHEALLCPRDVLQETLQAAGFEVRHDPDGLSQQRGLFVGRRST